MSTVPIKPYLVRAIHEWCSDQGYTPYLVVAVRGKMQVPTEYVKDGEITLNVGYNATRNLQMSDDFVRFSARFGGVSRDIIIPMGAVVSIFARECGEGMAWEPEFPAPEDNGLRPVPLEKPDMVDIPGFVDTPPPEDEPPPSPSPKRGHLRVVK